jgi:hypothetical protein
MSMRAIIFLSSLILAACVQKPVFEGANHSFIKSNYPIVSVNGNKVEPSYKVDLKPGENILVITYLAYRHDYYCTFKWDVTDNTAYEVVDQENRHPLTLYRWIRRNGLWAVRLDPVDPLECIEEPAHNRQSD